MNRHKTLKNPAQSWVIIEIYPALAARSFIGKQSYKSDQKLKQTQEMQFCRQEMINQGRSPMFKEKYGFSLDISDDLALPCGKQCIG